MGHHTKGRAERLLVAAAALATLVAVGHGRLGAEENVNEDERAAVTRARLALAEELGTDENALAEEGVSFARFPNSALGCPRPGEMSATVITAGWRVVLRAGDDRYDVRVSEDARLVRVCGKVGKASRARPSPAVQQDLRAAARAATAAREDLAARLAVPESQVRRVWARPVRWPPDEARDCAAPDPVETGSGVADFLVLLEHDGDEHRYRVDRDGALPCGDEDGGDGQ